MNNYDKIDHFCPECLSRCKYKKELTIDEIFGGSYIGSKTFCSKVCLENYKNKKVRKLSIYELEKIKYDEDKEFIEKYKNMYWKSFIISDLFKRDAGHAEISIPQKDMDKSDEKDEKYKILLISSSAVNNGIGGYLEDIGEINTKKKSNLITIVPGINAGATFYQENEFVTKGSNCLIVKDANFKNSLDKNKNSYRFIAKELSKIFCNKMHGWLPGAASAKDGRARGIPVDFKREIILLPMIQDDQGNEEIFTDAMAYLYLRSMILRQDKKIQNYNNKIKELKGE